MRWVISQPAFSDGASRPTAPIKELDLGDNLFFQPLSF
jgi:hypothetical protein